MDHLPQRYNKKSNWVISGVSLKKLARSYKITKKCDISKKHVFTQHILNKLVLEWAIYPIETTKNLIG